MWGRPRHLAFALVALALFAGACAGATGGPDVAAPGTPAPTVPAPTAPAPTEPAPTGLAGDWHADVDLALPNGWSVRGCEGDRPHMCVHDGDRLLGDVELLEYPLDEGEAELDPVQAATARAEGFIAHFAADRAQGCGEFAFEADDVRPATIGGVAGVRAGFALRADDGTVVERVVTHYAIHAGRAWVVNTDAYATEGGCLGPSEYDPSFTPLDIVTFDAWLHDLVADTPLPVATR